jgi:hypothetical protein
VSKVEIGLIAWGVLLAVFVVAVAARWLRLGDETTAALAEQDDLERGGWTPWREEVPSAPESRPVRRQVRRPAWAAAPLQAYEQVPGSWSEADDERFLNDVRAYRERQLLPGEQGYR